MTLPTRRRAVLRAEQLEDRLTPAAPFPEFLDPNPSAGNQFGATVVALSTGNVVITSPLDDFAATDAGAVYLFNGATGALISTLRGSTASDNVGNIGVTALTNGNYVVGSRNWNNGAVVDAGAATFGSGTAGISGPISAANSLVGTTANDFVGNNGVTALTNGNYVVSSSGWDNGAVVNAGAATFGSGTAGISGPISAANSLVGTTASDFVGGFGVTALTNGNYVVRSPSWDNGAVANAGAATFGSGTTGISGPVSAANSLVGTTANDDVGSFGVTALTNGNYVVSSSDWNNGAVVDAGAATFGSGTTGISGAVSAANSLVGTTANDNVGNNGVTALTNGNYVVSSVVWNNGAVANAGAATFGSGTAGISGAVSAANSLVGTTASDFVGGGVTALTNGNYVVRSSGWNNGAVVDAGAATFGSGTTGISGAVSAANSLVGTTASDNVGGGGVFALTNGNYVVSSSGWNNGAVVDAGAATFGSGTTGISGAVSAANSLVGTTASDNVGGGGVFALTNGNYVVSSSGWNNGAVVDAGAATFGSGTTGISGPVSAANSLVGTTASDQVGFDGVTALTNGNYVVGSRNWVNGALTNAGAATFGSGTAGISGPVSAANSLVGLTANASLQNVVPDNVNGTFFGRFVAEGGGRVRLGSQVVSTPLAVGGTGNGTAPVFNPGAGGQYGSTVATLSPFGAIPAKVRTAVGDVNNDGTPDTILVTGPGTPIRFAVVSGVDNSTLLIPPTAPFSGSEDFTGGGFVSAADLDGDGRAEIVVTPDQGGGPRVTIFSLVGTTPTVRANFLGVDDPAFRGGARSALGDINRDGKPDLLVAAGFGGGPRVALFDGTTLLSSRTKLRGDFFAFPEDAVTLRNGIFAALGDITGDGFADLIFGGGPGGAPRVFILSGQFLMSGNANLFSQPVANFFVAGNANDRRGVRLAAKDADGDLKIDLAVGNGEGSPANIRVYRGVNFITNGEPGTFQDLSVFGGVALTDGVFVG